MRDTENGSGSRFEDVEHGGLTLEDLAAESMRRVAEELSTGRGREAVRLFLEFANHAGRPKEISLSSWLGRTLNPGGISRLVTSMAQYPCFGCRNGYEPCGLCDGDGASDRGHICAACLGTVSSPCGFCNASGLAIYGLFPLQFRYAVLMERAGTAIALVRRSAAMPRADQIEPRREMQRLLDLNKLLGVLENATDAARELVDSGFRSAEEVCGLLKGCNEAALIAEEDVRRTLRRAAEGHRDSARDGLNSYAQASRDRAAFYERLACGSDLAGTLLEHRFLCRAQSQAEMTE